MNAGEIAERMIEAAAIEYRLPDQGTGGGSAWVAYTHTIADMNGWGEKRYQEEREQFWNRVKAQVTAPEVSRWEECRRWIIELVERPEERRALWAWAEAKAGGKAFKRWCLNSENVHPITGTRRKDRAIAQIVRHFTGRGFLNSETVQTCVLPETPENDYLPDNIATLRTERNGVQAWADDLAFQPFIASVEHDFSWAEKRNELRRQRAARLKKTA
ncbi:hypothetical protein GCM10007908_03520 [Rhizobium albus]|nr:hypothetical protein GCM10007908_03520 [Rhizobium albus]